MIDVILSFVATVLIVVPIFFLALVLEDDIHDALEDWFK